MIAATRRNNHPSNRAGTISPGGTLRTKILLIVAATVWIAGYGSAWRAQAGSAAQGDVAEAMRKTAEKIADNRAKGVVTPTAPDKQWFPEAGLGLFICWDPGCVEEVEIGWAAIAGCFRAPATYPKEEYARIIAEKDYYLEGYDITDRSKGLEANGTKRVHGCITAADYFRMAERFKAEHYDPGKWLKAARAAGFRYVIITTRHHAGYCLWPSKFGEFHTGTYLNGRNLLLEFVQAARANELKVGFYWSGPDWYLAAKHRQQDFLWSSLREKNPGFPLLDADWQPIDPAKVTPWKEYMQEMTASNNGKFRELINDFGPIDLLWFDCGGPAELLEEIKAKQPQAVLNPRWDVSDEYKHFKTVEGFSSLDHLKREEVEGCWWEGCFPVTGWSYVGAYDKGSTSLVLLGLLKARALAGNAAVGFGPRADGTMDEGYYAIMTELAGWMKQHAEVVHGKNIPFPKDEKLTGNVIGVAKKNVRYLCVLAGHNGRQELALAGVDKPATAVLLETGAAVEFRYDPATRTVTLALEASQRKNPWCDVVKLDW